MYKRISKRIKKKEEETTLDLDEGNREILGMNETDSDESDSSDEGRRQSDTDDSNAQAPHRTSRGRSTGIQTGLGYKQNWNMGHSSNDSGVGAEDSEAEQISESEDMEDNSPPPMTISEALNEPLYLVRKGSDARKCIVCPGKELKHSKMVTIHVASSSHLRRMKRFSALAARVGDEDEDPRLLVAALDESVRIVPKEKLANGSTGPRVSQKQRHLAKRQRRRERRAAKQTNSVSSTQPDSQPREQLAVTRSGSNAVADHVLRKKLLTRQLESINKHKKGKSGLWRTTHKA